MPHATPVPLVVDPPRAGTAALLAAVPLLLLAGALSDAGGRALCGPGAAVALVLAVRDLRVRPVLVADAEGLRVRQGWRHLTAAWPEVRGLAVVRDRRSPALQVDAGWVALLGRVTLGRDPDEVLEQLEGLRAGAGPSSPPP